MEEALAVRKAELIKMNALDFVNSIKEV